MPHPVVVLGRNDLVTSLLKQRRMDHVVSAEELAKKTPNIKRLIVVEMSKRVRASGHEPAENFFPTGTIKKGCGSFSRDRIEWND